MTILDDDKDLWNRDDLQFPRLIAEIAAEVELSDLQWQALCESMDLSDDELSALFDRAQRAWERIKAEYCPVMDEPPAGQRHEPRKPHIIPFKGADKNGKAGS